MTDASDAGDARDAGDANDAGNAGAETFGAAMDRLEAIVARLEGDESLDLEEALDLYRQGVTLAATCRRRLAGAQLTLTTLPVRPPDAGEAPDGDALPDDATPDGDV